MWPEALERIAAFLRVSGAEGRLEELLPGAGPPTGQKLSARGFDGAGAAILAIVPAGRSVDERKLAAAAGCEKVQPAAATVFPFEAARVFMDQSIMSFDAVWLEAGSPQHILGLTPVQLTRVTNAETADLLREG